MSAKTTFKDLTPLKTFAKASKSCAAQVSPIQGVEHGEVNGAGYVTGRDEMCSMDKMNVGGELMDSH